MFKGNYYKHLKIVSGFGVDRGHYKHSGVDYPGTKESDVVTQLTGVVDKILFAKVYFGTQIILKTNPKYVGGVDELLYHSYCHLSQVNCSTGQFLEAGSVIGKMGNSGGSYTRYDNNGRLTSSYRPVTEEEQTDRHCNYGVHLHLWFYEPAKPGDKTKLLKALSRMKLVSPQTIGDTHFYQWGKLIIAPRVIYKYFKLI